ncbi:MAG: adenylate kinase [Oscillospiraceae bacterium]|nr:adenylate kinase [Oscillospiraceae bacterium]
MFQKALVIGSPGAGKSTFARKLRDAAGLPLYHLDMLWHKPDKTTITPEEFDQKLAAILAKDRWVIDGNYLRTLETRIKPCDAVFLLDPPVDACLAAAEARIGTRRDDLPWVEESLDDEFRQYILDFPRTQLPAVRTLLEKYQKEKTVVIFRSWQESDNWLASLHER